MNTGPMNASQTQGNESEEQDTQVVERSSSGPMTGKPPVAEAQDSSRRGRRSGKSSSAFKTISEVADELDVQQHVLRFWETKFSQIRPLKRGGGRRYYRPEDLALLQRIHHLLYTEGYTIKGVQKLLREKGKAAVVGGAPAAGNSNERKVSVSASGSLTGMNTRQRAALKAMLGELKDLRAMLKPE